MKKTLCMKVQIVNDNDMQEYVQVSLSSARLVIFDFKTLDFVVFVIKQLAYSLNKELENTILDYRLLINVSSYGKVVVNLIDSIGIGNILESCNLDCLTLAYFRKVSKSPFDKIEIPDILVLLLYFLTDKQRSLCGF